MKNILFVFLLLICGITQVHSQTTDTTTKNVYQEIEVARHNAAILLLHGTDTIRKQLMIDSILLNPNYYNPPVIYALSYELFSQGKKDDATFWFYVAQLRARYDANLCLDNTAKQAVTILNSRYGPPINSYAFQNVDTLAKVVSRVVDFVRSNEENYDHRWINLHGMAAVLATTDPNSPQPELSYPRDKWADIKAKTIDDYYAGFVENVLNKPK